jgi:hypothetical protein
MVLIVYNFNYRLVNSSFFISFKVFLCFYLISIFKLLNILRVNDEKWNRY